jgi:hypothetical protein
VDEAEVISYHLSNHHGWRKDYRMFGNHWEAMTVVVKDLFEDCGLDVYPDRVWVCD